MKIFIISTIGRTAVEMGGFCANGFKKLGHQPRRLIYHDRRLSARMPAFLPFERAVCGLWCMLRIALARPDFILVIKGDSIPAGLYRTIRRRMRIPLVNYWIDDPHSIEVSRTVSPHFDAFFTNDPDSVEAHRKAGCPHPAFLSFGYDAGIHRRVRVSEEERRFYGSDVCFAATVTQNRYEVLRHLGGFDVKIWSKPVVQKGRNYRFSFEPVPADSPIYGKFTGKSLWADELAKAYASSKIILNIHVHAVPTMREFEVTGSGAFLLTDPAAWLDTMFVPGKEIVVFNGIDECKRLIGYYLSHPGDRAAIAENGHRRTLERYSYTQRMEQMISGLHSAGVLQAAGNAHP